MTQADKDKIILAIQKDHWDKYSYQYALTAMNPHGVWLHGTEKKQYYVDKFYELCETKFHCIKGFTTFRNLTFESI